jgi:glyoxylase-like metal-dependent hydrolase (beta-lactamase superfamily II)/rhodanese-related sulfurtransferase
VTVIPIVDEGLGNSAYLIDLGDGQGMVIDPERNPRPYLDAAERLSLTVRWVVETHLHADFVSGGRELAARGARLLAPAASGLMFDHKGVADGDEVDLGGLTMRVIATPGHTPEHCAYLLLDGVEPLALFSGGTLIVGGVARTDLISPELTEELARAAYRSIKERLLVLPDALPVYPTHGAGSFCSAALTGERTTTIGRERVSNPLLQAKDETDFVARLSADLGSYPVYFLRLREVNQMGATVYGASPPTLRALRHDEVARLVEQGAEIVDLRPVSDFAGGHIPASLSIQLRSQFSTWLGWLVEPDRVLVFIGDPDREVPDAVVQCLNIGYENFGGYLAGGIDAWQRAGHPMKKIPLVSADQIPATAAIVDVRQRSEWESGHVEGALHLELGEMAELGTQLAGDLVLHCGHGQRSMTAASLLERAGRTDVAVTTASADELAQTRGIDDRRS